MCPEVSQQFPKSPTPILSLDGALARIDPSNGGFRRAHTLFVDGATLYEVTPQLGFPEIRVFNVSDPAHPTFVRSIPSPSGEGIHEVTVRNGRLFTANFHSGGHVDIFDISHVGDLSRPVPLLGTFHTGDGTHTALSTEDGRFVVVTKEWAGHPLEIYDVSDPARPTLASTISVPRAQAFSSHQPAIVGNLLYVAWFEAGVRVYNIADRYHPVLVGSYDTYTGPYGEEGECAGLDGTAHGVNSDVVPGAGPEPCGAWGVYPFFGNDKILVSDFDHGLFVVSLDGRLTAASTVARAVNETLHIGQVQPLLAEAIHRWQSAGANTSVLHGIDIRIANLGGTALGLASGHTIWLDDNAAGWGWFVDRTPRNDSEFTTRGNQGEKHRMDLLSVLTHEVGHLLGHDHAEGGVMAETLAPGERLSWNGLAGDSLWNYPAAPDFTWHRARHGWWS